MGEKGPDFFAKNPQKKWETPGEAQSIEVISKLEGALESRNAEEVQGILNDPQKVRLAIKDRRDQAKGLVLLHSGFDFLLAEEFGDKADIFQLDPEKLLDWIHKKGLSEIILTDDMRVSYHRKMDGRFFRMLGIIAENKEELSDPNIFSEALHNQATWEKQAEGNLGKSIETNKQVLERVDATGGAFKDTILRTKASVGITVVKTETGKLRPKNQASDYEKYLQIFSEHGADEEAVFSIIEAARAYLVLSKGQWGNSRQLGIQNLDKAEYLAKEGLRKATAEKYSVGIFRAHKILAEIYAQMGKKDKTQKHRSIAEKLKKETRYSY